MLKVLHWTVIGRTKVPGKINCVWFRNRRATIEKENWPWENVWLLKIDRLDSELRTNSIFGFFSSVRAERFSVGWLIVGPKCGLTFVSEILLCCALNFWSDYIWEVVFSERIAIAKYGAGKMLAIWGVWPRCPRMWDETCGDRMVVLKCAGNLVQLHFETGAMLFGCV